MREPGRSRERLARILGAAFAEGLLSEQTLSYRLELLYAPGAVEPGGLIGDLPAAARARTGITRVVEDAGGRLARRLAAAAAALRGGLAGQELPPLLLALDWAAARWPLTIGRSSACDVVIAEPTVSRRHALLRFRDGAWVVQDLASRNGLTVNGEPVGRRAVGPGDRLGLGRAVIELD